MPRAASNRGQLRSSQIFQQPPSSNSGTMGTPSNPTSPNVPTGTSVGGGPAGSSGFPPARAANPWQNQPTSGGGGSWSSVVGPRGTTTTGAGGSQPQAPSGPRRMGSLGTSTVHEDKAVVGNVASQVIGSGGSAQKKETHPLREDWTFYFVHRPPGAKVTEYEKEIKKVASFGSVSRLSRRVYIFSLTSDSRLTSFGLGMMQSTMKTESFWPIYAHILPPGQLPAVTDLLLFASRIKKPIWEELPNGGKWTLRLRKGVADRLWENLILALIGDQFDEEEGIVGAVLSVRAQEDILSVWSDRESETADSDDEASVQRKLIRILGLPTATAIEYKSNRSLIETSAQKHAGHGSKQGAHHFASNGQVHGQRKEKA